MSRHLESLRGAACLLLVLYHVVGSDAGSGLRIGDGWLRTTNDWLAVLRMPLFGLLAGWFYAERPAISGQLSHFVSGKAQRLLLPSLSVGSLYLIAQLVAPGVNNRSTGIPLLSPVAHLWFIQALFLVFVTVALAERIGLLRTLDRMYLTLAAAAALYLSGVGTPWLGIGGAIYLLPYVLLGIALQRFGDIKRLRDPACIILLIAAIWALAAANELDFSAERRTVAYLAVATCMMLIALASGLQSRLLIRVGSFSYAIFLFHPFFAAAARVMLEQAGLPYLVLQLPLGLVSAVAGPILVQRLLRSWPPFNTLFLGEGRPRSRSRKTAERIRPAAAGPGKA